jgi:two-component system, chemotaxis family, chemotaxis protein CheY
MPTILVVDDSPTIRRMVMASLAAVPKTVLIEAASGLQAIEALAVSTVHLVVLDLNMPDMHGVDVLRFVRSHDHYRNVPVIVLTTRGDSTSRDSVLQAGASAYMTKPFAPSALASTVRELLASSTTAGLPVSNGL